MDLPPSTSVRALAEEQPSTPANKSLLIRWALILGEMTLDLATSSIGVIVGVQYYGLNISCCNDEVIQYAVPLLAVAVPYFCLVAAEMRLMAHVIQMSLWPRLENERENRWCIERWLDCCLYGWEAQRIFQLHSFLLTFNQFLDLSL
jgi:hypothetical protein